MFDASGLIPHGFCLSWRPELFWSLVFGNSIIAISYLSISATIIMFIYRRGLNNMLWVGVLFSAFITLCAFTHAIDVWTLWLPDYDIQVIVLGSTAIISALTAIFLWRLFPLALEIPSVDELKALVAKRTQELEDKTTLLLEAKIESDRASLAKSKFLAAASHDLRQPVQSLVLFLSVLKAQANTPVVAKAASAMEGALDGLNGLLNSILDISRIDAGVVAPQMHVVDIGGLVHRLGTEYAPLCGQKGLRLRCRSKLGLHARTDAALLERIIRNLVENAIRYTDHGGLLIGTRRRGDSLRIDIVDTGIGIPADKLPNIYEEFYQVANPARDSRQGLGLGLSIVSRLARLIGAEVLVRSNQGRGTCFSVLLPREAASLEMSRPSAVAEVVTGQRIMVIEDNPTVRMGLQLMLESWNCEVVSAETGEQALEAGERDGWRFDAVIADYRLGPGLTGTDTAAEFRRRSGQPIPALIVTGDTAPERIEEVHASGFEMVHKPVTPDELARRMAQLLRGGG